jgi:hypothetical protein
MRGIHLQKALKLIDEALTLAVSDGEKTLAFILQVASLEASERIESISGQKPVENNDKI